MTDVTKQGLVGERPGREAMIGAHGTTERFRGGRKRRRRGGEQLMVPPAEPVSYYGRPVIKAPVWSARDIAGYLFTGGLAGASSVVAGGAELTGRPVLARAAKVTALGAVSVSGVLLVHDLGRPERFYNMLRVFKLTSPMSVGSWILTAYAPFAGIAALTEVTGWFPTVGRGATLVAAGVGPAVASYTGVLIADTAVPAWHEAYRELPFVFVASAAMAASGAGLICAPASETLPLRRAAVLGAVVEQLAAHRMESHGLVSEPYDLGKSGRLLRIARGLAIGGAVGAALGGRNRLVAAASGAALVAGSACTRFGIFQAGMQSAEDPKYTLQPQRDRLTAAGR
ncbi:polysulfide reductase NrfD [Acidothermaceae bacterium B102]|nr:polysulfide reductase NrfD [Acidothermaceae bacterium B102]